MATIKSKEIIKGKFGVKSQPMYLRLPNEIVDQIRVESERSGIPISLVLRLIIEQKFKNKKIRINSKIEAVRI